MTKTLICVTLLVVSVFAKEGEKIKDNDSQTKRGVVVGQAEVPAEYGISTIDHASHDISDGNILAGSGLYHGLTSPWNYGTGHHYLEGLSTTIGSGDTFYHKSVVHQPVPVPVPHPVSVKIDRPVPVPVPVSQPYPVHVDKHYPVHVVKEVPYPVVKDIPYPVIKPVPYPVENPVPYPVVKNVPYPVQVRVDRPYPVPVIKPYPVPVEKKVLYPVDKIVHYPVKVPQRVAVPHPYPVPVPKPYPVPVPQPIPVPYDRPYPVKVIKPVPVPYERRIPVPVPHPVPVYIPKPYPYPVPRPVHVHTPIAIGTSFDHGSSTHDFSGLFVTKPSTINLGYTERQIIPSGSLVSNSGAVLGTPGLSASAGHGSHLSSTSQVSLGGAYFPSGTHSLIGAYLPSTVKTPLVSPHLNFHGSFNDGTLSSLADTSFADSSSIVEITKSIELPVTLKVSRSPEPASLDATKSTAANKTIYPSAEKESKTNDSEANKIHSTLK